MTRPPVTTELPPESEAFLRAFRRALSALPADVREELVAEIRAHLADRAADPGRDPLEDFGDPEVYAAQFLEAHSIRSALDSGGAISLAKVLQRSTSLGAWLFVVVPLGVLQLLGGCCIALAIAKPLFPANVGLFVGPPHTVILGGAIPAPSAPEQLGYWAIPLFLGVGAALVWSATRALRALAERHIRGLGSTR